MKIRQVKFEDMGELAIIYKELWDNVCIGEFWTVETATELLKYYYERQKDLFFVAEENEKAVGAIASIVKPWFAGNRLIDTEIFVSKDYQHKGIASQLCKRQFEEAIKLYNCQMIEFHTYGNEKEFPQTWYRKIGFKTDEELVIMNADIRNVLKNFE